MERRRTCGFSSSWLHASFALYINLKSKEIRHVDSTIGERKEYFQSHQLFDKLRIGLVLVGCLENIARRYEFTIAALATSKTF